MVVLVAVFSPNAAWTLPRAAFEALARQFPQHEFLDAWTEDDVERLLPRADVAFTAYLNRGQVGSLTRLRWVQSPAAGVGHLLSTELGTSDIVLTSARGVRAHAIAEHILAVTLMLARQLHAALRRQLAREWDPDVLEARIVTLSGRRMTIVGFGAIGQELARIAAPIGLRISAVRRRPELGAPDYVEEAVAPETLDALLPRTDVLVLAAPLTPDTKFLIGEPALNRIRKGALLVNVGRGKLIDDGAVVAALNDGRLGGAALDVFTKEPLSEDSPYWTLPNVIVTPHTSGAMEDYWTPLLALFAENLRRFEAGQPLLNVVDKTAGY